MLFVVFAVIANVFLTFNAANDYARTFYSSPSQYRTLYQSLPQNDKEASEVLENSTQEFYESFSICWSTYFLERAVLSEINERLNYPQYLEGGIFICKRYYKLGNAP